MRQLSTRDQNDTQTLTTIGHRTAFNNEQSPYRIVSYMFYSLYSFISTVSLMLHVYR